MQPIILPDMDQLVAKFPPAAKADLVEWNPGITPAQFLARILHAEYDIQRDLNPDVSFQITDDPAIERILPAAADAERPQIGTTPILIAR